jgi:lactate dehydrogenase-like 2-hydroxyacid dehydrogenase
MPAPIVLITRHVPGPVEIPGAELRTGGADQMPRAALLDAVRGATAVITMFHDRVDDEFLAAAGPSLRGVCNFAVGFDNIDLAACARRGVIVTNTPDAVTEGTANLTLALILAVARRLAEGDRFVRAGRFEREGNGFPVGWMGMHLTGQALLVIGPGRIGTAVAHRARAFGMSVLYAARSRHLDFELAPIAAARADLDDGLRRADVVTVHVPLTHQTRHLLDSRRLALLKPTAILVNTSRGPVVDEAALADALRHRRIWGAGLDVFEHEPRVHPDLLGLDNVVLTPHIGSAERRYREMMTQLACANAAAIIAGREPPNRVPAPSP